MNFMLEALGRDIRVTWNRFVWHPTIDAMQAAMLREVWAEYRLRRISPITYRAVCEMRDHGPFGYIDTSNLKDPYGIKPYVAPRYQMEFPS